MTIEQTPGEPEGTNHVAIWVQDISGQRNYKLQKFWGRYRLELLKEEQETHMITENERRKAWRNEIWEVTKDETDFDLSGHCNNSDLIISEIAIEKPGQNTSQKYLDF